MYFKRLMAGLGLLAFLFLAIAHRVHTSKPVQWPRFEQAQSGSPAAVIKLERDYGYRTGDIVPVEIFLQEQPGMKIDLDSLVFEGDFEVRGDATLQTRTAPDGQSTHYIKVDLQSLAVKDKLESGLSFVWESLADKKIHEWRADAAIKVSTSPTWDGRPNIRMGDRQLRTGFHWVYSGALIATSLFIMIWCNWVILRYERHGKIYDSSRRRYVNPAAELRARLCSTWQQITAGSTDIQLFTELNADLRKLFGIPTVPVENIPSQLNNSLAEPTQRVLFHCEQVIFGHKSLAPEEMATMNHDLDLILGEQKSS